MNGRLDPTSVASLREEDFPLVAEAGEALTGYATAIVGTGGRRSWAAWRSVPWL
ncbi:hypothetical protein SVIOM74S_03271 [Streptomyces violarus]